MRESGELEAGDATVLIPNGREVRRVGRYPSTTLPSGCAHSAGRSEGMSVRGSHFRRSSARSCEEFVPPR